jgi:hypothetical protein
MWEQEKEMNGNKTFHFPLSMSSIHPSEDEVKTPDLSLRCHPVDTWEAWHAAGEVDGEVLDALGNDRSRAIMRISLERYGVARAYARSPEVDAVYDIITTRIGAACFDDLRAAIEDRRARAVPNLNWRDGVLVGAGVRPDNGVGDILPLMLGDVGWLTVAAFFVHVGVAVHSSSKRVVGLLRLMALCLLQEFRTCTNKRTASQLLCLLNMWSMMEADQITLLDGLIERAFLDDIGEALMINLRDPTWEGTARSMLHECITALPLLDL